MVRNASKPVGRRLHRDVVVLRLIRQRHEADEAPRLVLQRAQLPQMIHAVGERFDVAEQHRAGAASAELVPGAVDIQIFLGGFLALGDGAADFLAENLRAAAGERFESGGFQFNQRLLDGFLREPGEVQDFNRGEAFELKPGSCTGSCRHAADSLISICSDRTTSRTLIIQRAQRLQHVRVVTERQRGMQSADDVQFRDAELQRLARLLDHLRDGQLEAVRVALLARERAELAAQDAVVRVVEVAIDDVAGAVAHLLLSREIGDGAEGVEVLGFKQPQRVGFGNAFAGGDLVVEVAQFAALNEEIHTAIDSRCGGAGEARSRRKRDLLRRKMV